jgi:hypothetical protein
VLAARALKNVSTATAAKVHFGIRFGALLGLRQEPHALSASTTIWRFVSLNPTRRTKDLAQNLPRLAAGFPAPSFTGLIVIVKW